MPDQFEASREGQYTEKQLKWSIWWVEHRIGVRRILTVVVGVVGFSLLGYGLFGFADWFFGSGVKERYDMGVMAEGYSNYAPLRAAHTPQQPMVDRAFVLSGGVGSYDFVSTLTNPNEEWVAVFQYTFRAGAVISGPHTGYALPGDKVWLMALGVRGSEKPASVTLEVSDIDWQRVDYHDTRPDYATWAKTRLGITAADAEYLPVDATDALGTSRARFTVSNDTAFGYREVGLTVSLWNGTRLTGINHVVITNLRAGERRAVEAVWFTDVPGVTRVEVKPEINIFDERNYLEVGR